MEIFQEFKSNLRKDSLQLKNTHLNKVIQSFEYYFLANSNHDNQLLKEIQQRKPHSIMFITEYIESEQKKSLGSDYFLICYENTLIIIDQTEISQLYSFFYANQDLIIYTTSDNIQHKFEEEFHMKLQIENEKRNDFFIEEIANFSQNFSIKKVQKNIELFAKIIFTTVSGYLIKKAYKRAKEYDRLNNYKDFENEINEKSMKQDEYIILRKLGDDSVNDVRLIYHIESEQFFAQKIFMDSEVLFERERSNYLNIQNFYIPKYIGTAEYFSYKTIVIEYLYGKSLENIDQMKLTKEKKITMIYQILLCIKYLHNKGFIYRDLKPNNIFYNQITSNICIIDFDRMIYDTENYDFTRFFLHEYIAPEIISNEQFSKEVDIYSIGKIINYIFSNEFLLNPVEFSTIKEISEKCTKDDPKERPKISDLIKDFFINIVSKTLDIKEEDSILLYYFVEEYFLFEVYLSSVEINNKYAQLFLGKIFFEGKYVSQDINKAIYYFTLAANQNDSDAQFNLGKIFFEDKYVTRNINKAIYYLTLAANQNDSYAQFYLGTIYYKGKFVTQDINKAIYYFTLAANQNDSYAQFILGIIYYKGKFVTRDINKAIYYFTLAANQNDSDAQFYLGIIYYKGKFVTRDINKAIQYFTLAANQNDPKKLFKLGLIYYLGQDIIKNINKSIHYLTLAANQNHPDAQYILATIYDQGQYVTKDINKAMYYYTFSADQNNRFAQFSLGMIYYEGKYIKQDINKAIYYFKQSSDQNHFEASFYLGIIYYFCESIKSDVNKSIHYFTLASKSNITQANFFLGSIFNKAIHYFSLAAKYNNSGSQIYLGILYMEGKYVPQDINKSFHYLFLALGNNSPAAQCYFGVLYLYGYKVPRNIQKSIKYLSLSADNNFFISNFLLGCIYLKGIDVNSDIDKSIHYFKKSSSFNDNCSKNNLGIIYSRIKQNRIAIEYFEESIRQKNDPLSMYNLGHIYFYGKFNNENHDKAIELFIKSSNERFEMSEKLLSLAIFMKIKHVDFDKISTEIEKYSKNKELIQKIYKYMIFYNFEINHQKMYKEFSDLVFLYGHFFNPILFSEYMENFDIEFHQSKDKKNEINQYNLTSDFHDGFFGQGSNRFDF